MAAPTDGLPVPRRYWSVFAIWMALAIAVLDGAIANVALPTMARELHANAAASIWIINAYQLAMTVAVLPLAALGDRLGYRRISMGGLAVFTLGSLACALSHDLTTLVAARVFQGLGAAGIMSVNAALVRLTYPRRLLGHGIGLNAVVVSVSAAIGPTVASIILGVASWEWLFAVNVPIGVVTFFIARRSLPRTTGSSAPFDYMSAVLNAIAFGFLILGADSAVREGLAVGGVKLAIGAVAAVLLARRELKVSDPLVPLDLMRIPIFGLSVATSIVSFGSQMLAYVALPFYFEGPMGRSAVATGLLMTPWSLGVAVASPVAGRLSDRRHPGLLGGLGLGVFSLGLFTLFQLRPTASDMDIVWRMALCGLGFGFFQSPNSRALMSAAPLHRSGAAGGMMSTARMLGQTAGALGMALFFHLAGANAAVMALATASGFAGMAALISLSRLRIVERPGPSPEPLIGDSTHGP